MRKTRFAVFVLLLELSQSGCAPEVGSKKWCEQLEDKPKGDWTANEVKAFAKYCVFENYVDKAD